MGCPPDPIDVSIGRGNNESVALKEKAELLIPQAKRAALFLVELGKNHTDILPEEMLSKANSLHREANRFQASHLGQTFGYGDFENFPDSYPNMSVMYSHLSDSEKYVKNVEINLCIARDLILKAVGLLGEKSLSEKEHEIFIEEKELHLIHRREDRDIKIKTLENDISTCKFVISTKEYDYSQEERNQRAEMLKQLEPEYQRILAITDEELLQNRELF